MSGTWYPYVEEPAAARCSRCLRSTWDQAAVGTEDRMTQPDGCPCGGTFVAVTP